MKKKLMVALAMGLTFLGAKAVPAHPQPQPVIQPDGTTLTVRLVGDEFYNYYLTTDGRTIVQTDQGAYVYAEANADGSLRAGSVMAHEPAQRQAAEKAYLSALPQHLVPKATGIQREMRSGLRSMTGQRGVTNYKKFKGLVLLVNYTDRKFSYTNAHEMFTDMVTKQNYDGFMTNAAIPTKVKYTGSVRDYFYDQSLGMFDPQFDVVGPIDINYSATSPRQTSNMATIVRAVIQAADSQVDFSKYDTDGDGKIDMFYIIFAGFGSNYSGNNTNYVWPHAWDVSNYYITADGVRAGRYACSTEMGGWQSSSNYIDGIGVICHEFSHVLGLMDEYDTDYENSGGQSADPGEWSVMAGGSYQNNSRTPCGYSLFQRYQSGFTVPKIITEPGNYTVFDIDTCGTGYRINTPEPKEYFLLENRRKVGSKWNCYLPGQGMLVFRVDSTYTSVWTNNDINVNPAHNYYELVRAKAQKSGSTVTDSGGDPFPGTGNVTSLTPDGDPAFKTWGGLNPNFGLDSIWEQNGVIYFRIAEDNTKAKIEDFEAMVTNGKYDENVKGTFTTWNFSNAWVESTTRAAGKALAMVKGSTATTALIPSHDGWLKSCSFTVTNNSGKSAYIRLQALVNGVMTVMKTRSGSTNTAVANGATSTISYPLNDMPETLLELSITTGSSDTPLYIDDFTVTKDYPAGIGELTLDSSREAPLQARINGYGIEVLTRPGQQVCMYDLQGHLLVRAATDASGTAVLTPMLRGCYIITSGGKAIKVLF